MRWSLVFFIWNAIYFGHGLIAERRERASALKTAELQLLKAQLYPHFLFNALNAIRALIADEPVAAQDAVTRMARILRYTLGQKDDTVDLAHELAIVDDYLALEQLRLGERLVVVRDIQATGRIPVMLVQGLVENAIKHGIARRTDGGVVTITTRREGRILEITVTNPLPPKRLATTEGTGIDNMRGRLRLLSDGEATLTLDLARDIATARVRIPQR
jgi:LytS/YehU family sensor histidine kinase